MKNWKRIAALAAVVVLLLIFCLPMVFALLGIGEGKFSAGMFQASLFAALFVAVMAYAIWLVYRILNKRRVPKNPGEIQNVVFDVGRVLVDFDWEAYLKGFGFPKEEYDKIAKAVFQSKVWDERDRGLYDEEEYIRQFIDAAPEYKADIRKVMRDSYKTIVLRPYALTWVKYLRKQGYRLFVLSNYSKGMMDRTRNRLEFLPYMDGSIFSYEVKMLKPDLEIYQELLNRYQLDPKTCVFIDDRKENCRGAEKAGMRSVCFRDFKQAAADLEKLGVK